MSERANLVADYEEVRSALAQAKITELRARVAAYTDHQEDNATFRRQQSDVYSVDPAAEVLRLEAELDIIRLKLRMMNDEDAHWEDW